MLSRRRFLIGLGSLVLGRRLLVAAGGGGGFPTPSQAFTVTAEPQGAWPWGNAHRISDHTYIAFTNNAGGLRVAIWDHSTHSATTSAIEADGFFTADQHDSPALLERTDGRLLAVYMGHGSAEAYRRVTVNTLGSDPTISGGWQSRTNIDSQLGSTAYTYPDLHRQDDGIYLFYRDVDGLNNWEWSKSTDEGASWSSFVNVGYGSGAYARSVSSSGTRIDFAITDGTAAEDQASMYHFYRDGTTYYKTDGTPMAGSPPFAFSAMTKVWDGPSHSAGSRAPGDIVVIGGDVAIVWPVGTGTPHDHIGADEDYIYARSTGGGSWATSTVAANVGALTFEFTEGSLAIDRTNLDRLLVSRRAVSDLAYPFRMYDVTSPDGGATWPAGRVVSVDDGHSATYPAFVRNATREIEAVWLQGSNYTSQNDFSTGIVGYGLAGF